MSRFDERAREWDTPERVERAAAAAAAIREHVSLDRTMRVIDLGAGTGLLGFALADEVASVVLAEPSAGMLEVAREKAAAWTGANVSVAGFDLPGDPPAGAPFDLAVSLLVLHHVEDTAAALHAVHDLLAPGGRIALLDLDAEDGSFHSEDAEGIHHHGFDRGELLETAAAAGFADLASRIVMAIEQDGRPYPVFLLTGRRA
jgi:2-polyprenyl-3-methyl-5-hydroxy-6-metoxy-1,4-benzoquinol methylase